jgi:hypothetical protein
LWTPEGWDIFVKRHTDSGAKVTSGNFEHGTLFAVVQKP